MVSNTLHHLMNDHKGKKMRWFSNLSLKIKLTLSVTLITFIGLILTVSMIVTEGKESLQDITFQHAEVISQKHAIEVEAYLNHGLEIARGIARDFAILRRSQITDRAIYNQILIQALKDNPDFIATWTIWEPNALDNNDKAYIGQKGTDPTNGRYIPYFNRKTADGSIVLDKSIDKPEDYNADFYGGVKATKREVISKPATYSVNGQPTLLSGLAVPLIIQDQVVGVVGVDIDLNALQQRLAKIKLYNTGFVTLIANDGTRVTWHDPSKIGKPFEMSSKLPADLIQIVKDKIRQGEKHHLRIPKINREWYLHPIKIGQTETPWGLVGAFSLESVTEKSDHLMQLGMILSGSTLLFLAGLIMISLYFFVNKPLAILMTKIKKARENGQFNLDLRLPQKDELGELTEHLHTMVWGLSSGLEEIKKMMKCLAQGNLTQKMSSNYVGDLAIVSADTNRAITALSLLIVHLKTNVTEMSQIAYEVAHGNDALSNRTVEQTHCIENATIQINKMREQIAKNTQSAEKINQIIIELVACFQQGQTATEQAVQVVEEIAISAKNIAQITNLIDEIAEQTNLLALNASIESARAGEAGRGFAIVANEVRALAQRSAQAAKEIKTLTHHSVEKVTEGQGLIHHTKTISHDMEKTIHIVSELMTKILEASRDQNHNVHEVGNMMHSIQTMTAQNDTLVERLNQLSNALEKQSQDVTGAIETFKVGSNL